MIQLFKLLYVHLGQQLLDCPRIVLALRLRENVGEEVHGLLLCGGLSLILSLNLGIDLSQVDLLVGHHLILALRANLGLVI